MKITLTVKEEKEGNIWEKAMEKANTFLGFRLGFLDKTESQVIHKVEVRNINFQDLMRHLQRGELIFITPTFQEDFSAHTRKYVNRDSWYLLTYDFTASN